MADGEREILLIPYDNIPGRYNITSDGIGLAWMLFTKKMTREETNLSIADAGLLLDVFAEWAKLLEPRILEIKEGDVPLDIRCMSEQSGVRLNG